MPKRASNEVKKLRREFGKDSGLARVDFRPHFDGDLVTLYSCVEPHAEGERQTVDLVARRCRAMAAWLLEQRKTFGPLDRFMLIVAWAAALGKTDRQIVKCGGTWQDVETIADKKTGDGAIIARLAPGWGRGVFVKKRTVRHRQQE